MKKFSLVIVFAVFALVSTTTFAQEGMEVAAQDATEAVQEVVQEKVEVQISELPEAVTKTLATEFVDYTAEKAFQTTENEKVVYYVGLTKENEALTVVIDAEGNIVDKK